MRGLVSGDDEAVQQELQHLRERSAELKPAPDGVSAKGDVVSAARLRGAMVAGRA